MYCLIAIHDGTQYQITITRWNSTEQKKLNNIIQRHNYRVYDVMYAPSYQKLLCIYGGCIVRNTTVFVVFGRKCKQWCWSKKALIPRNSHWLIPS